MRETFTRCLQDEARNNENLVLITGDLGFGVLFPFMKEFPNRFINAGISEQAMMSMAAGMAMEQRYAEVLLKRADLAADGGLAHEEAAGAGKASGDGGRPDAAADRPAACPV